MIVKNVKTDNKDNLFSLKKASTKEQFVKRLQHQGINAQLCKQNQREVNISTTRILLKLGK